MKNRIKVKAGTEHSGNVTSESPRPAPVSGFANTPPVLRYGGPQMEDYADWDAWLFARRLWALERMGASVNPRMKEAAEALKLPTRGAGNNNDTQEDGCSA